MTFGCNDEGKLFIARVYQPDLSVKIGDYPIINSEQAKELLLNGNYITTVPYEISEEKFIKKWNLIYRTGEHEECFMPYYRFFVELPEDERENGLKTYGHIMFLPWKVPIFPICQYGTKVSTSKRNRRNPFGTKGCTPCAALRLSLHTHKNKYTRRWRLYHFCGFYYPIREVIPIAIYHWNIGIVSRGKGKSAVAAAAYRSGEKLTNEWDGMTHTTPAKAALSIQKSCCRPTRHPHSLTVQPCGTAWSFTRKPGTPSLPERLTQHSP